MLGQELYLPVKRLRPGRDHEQITGQPASPLLGSAGLEAAHRKPAVLGGRREGKLSPAGASAR